ncbi:MAG: hypothetical protein GPJ51_05830 [Candidatus Heimdallarchaeota archaeon]|nr:hypothetical protein [Candidatus Heimdallarchaeota archaeon]
MEVIIKLDEGKGRKENKQICTEVEGLLKFTRRLDMVIIHAIQTLSYLEKQYT